VVKFQVFGADDKGAPRSADQRADGRHRHAAADLARRKQAGKASLIDQSYAPEQGWATSKAALETAGTWLRVSQKLEPVAVGHRIGAWRSGI